ncbi:MAG: hypothetical protein UY07_C0030G0001, partial [Parcubacteria group bacterium GW2011_GWA1_47_8]
MTLSDWLWILVVFSALSFLVVLAIWATAKIDTGMLFGFLKEGQGTFVMRGESVDHPLISARGYDCKLISETRNEYNQAGEHTNEREVARYKIVETEKGTEATCHDGFLGWLEGYLGIYFFGFPPFYKRMYEEFRWNEWKPVKNKDGTQTTELWPRDDMTTFFYVQTFNYAVFVEGAETGGTKKATVDAEKKDTGNSNDVGLGGNVSVDLKINLPIRIIYPEIAVFENEDWFETLESIVTECVRQYTGQHTFEELRSKKDIGME